MSLSSTANNVGIPTLQDVGIAAITGAAVGGSTAISPDDQQAQYKESSQFLGIYTDYVINSRYEKDNRIYAMGITSSQPFQGASLSLVQLASPTLFWIVDWTAEKYGEPPDIPEADIIGDWVLVDEHYEPAMLSLAGDGVTPIYRISGTYFYAHKRPDKNTLKDISFSIPPWMENVYKRKDNLRTDKLLTVE